MNKKVSTMKRQYYCPPLVHLAPVVAGDRFLNISTHSTVDVLEVEHADVEDWEW